MKQEKMNLDKLREARDNYTIVELPISEKELCDRYEKLFTGVVSDVMRENVMLKRVLPSNIMPLRDEMKVAGIAFTIKSVKDSTTKGEMEMRGKMLQEVKNNDVCIWYTGGDDISAHWGEVMTLTAKARGCKGAVVDGGLRDIENVLTYDFPIFYKYRTPNGSLGRCRMIGYQIPIIIGDVIVYPGDIIFGDINGVVIVPRKMAYDVLIRAEELVNSEKEIKEWINKGNSPTEIVAKGGYF